LDEYERNKKNGERKCNISGWTWYLNACTTTQNTEQHLMRWLVQGGHLSTVNNNKKENSFTNIIYI